MLLATTTLTAVADAYVRDGAAANFGSDPTLVVKGSPTVGNTRRTYVKFDVGGVADADAVTLRLFGSASASSPAVNLSAFGVDDVAWGESTINWNNKPALSGSALSTRTISGTADKTYEWDVTSHVQAALAAGDTFVTLAVQPATSSTANPTAEFDAREGAVDPQLVVTTDDGTPPPPAAALRIDAAGGPTNASGGVVFAKDAGFSGGYANTDTFAVAGTTDDALYATRRTGDFTYANAVANGDYTLNLLFADHYTAAGRRRFHVTVEGQQVLTNLDIVAEAGSKAALVKSFPVTVGDGTLNMTFTSVVGYASVSAFELLPDDSNPPPPVPTLSINDVSKNEGNVGTTAFTFTVTRGGDTTVPVAVQYATSDQSTNPNDYAAASGTVSFAAGETSKQVTVDVNGDTTVEPDETFLVALSGATGGGATIADGTGLGTIVNDDSVTGPAPTLSINDAMGAEGNSGTSPLVFTVTRAGDTSGSSTVNWATQNVSAGEGDYQVAGGSLSFGPGQTTRTISISLKGDTKVEGNEVFRVNLSGATGASIADGVGEGTIVNDDQAGSTNISNITWTRNAPRSPIPRTEAGVVQVGSKLYSIGGFTAQGGTGTFFPLTRRVHVYDMATRTWSELASLPRQAAGNHMGVASDGTYIYTVAGQVEDTYGAGTNTAWRYHIATNTWSMFPSLPEVRFGGAAFFQVAGWLHFIGGDEADRVTPTTDHWAINLSNTAAGWIRKASLPLPGDHMSHATINGKVYLFGGEHGHQGLDGDGGGTYVQHNYTFEYNPNTDTWATKANMPLALSHVEGSTLVINGKAVLIGGLLTGGGSNTTNRVHVYDPVANSWRTLSTRYPKRIIGAAAGYWNGKIYMTDGYSPDENDRSVGFEGTVVFA